MDIQKRWEIRMRRRRESHTGSDIHPDRPPRRKRLAEPAPCHHVRPCIAGSRSRRTAEARQEPRWMPPLRAALARWMPPLRAALARWMPPLRAALARCSRYVQPRVAGKQARPAGTPPDPFPALAAR
jgi:hypothetical protein